MSHINWVNSLILGGILTCASGISSATPATHSLELDQTKQDGNSTPLFTLKPINPEATSPASLSIINAKAGEIYSARIEAPENMTGQAHFKLLEGPEYLLLVDDGLFQWAPDFTDAGRHKLRIEISTATSQIIAEAILLVASNNRAPQFTSSAIRKTGELESYSYRFSAVDADGDVLTYTLIKAPEGMSLKGQTLSWTPNTTQAGQHLFTVMASDGHVTSEQSTLLTVSNTNRKPQWITTSLNGGSESNLIEQLLRADDADNDALYFSIIQGVTGMHIDDRGLFSWTPDFQSAGVHNVEIQVSDGHDSIRQQFTLHIADTAIPQAKTNNLALLKSLVGMQIKAVQISLSNEDTARLKTIDSNDKSINIALLKTLVGMQLKASEIAKPVDQDTLLATIETNDKTSNLALLKALASIQLQATERSLSPADQEKLSTIDSNDDASNLALLKMLVSLQFKASDSAQPTSSEDLLAVIDSNDYANNLALLKTLAIMQLNADEQASAAAFAAANINHPPVWSTTTLAPATESLAYTQLLMVADEDGDAISFRLKKGPKGLTLSETGMLTWLPDFDAAGEYTLLIRAEDDEDRTDISLTLTVANTNRKPGFNNTPALIATENTAYTYETLAHDADGDIVTEQLLQGPEGMTLLNGKLQWTPDYEQAGSYPITLEISDGTLTQQLNFILQVDNSNRKPVFSQPDSVLLQLSENNAWQLPISASDDDGDKLEITLAKAPEGLKLQNNTLHWTPSYLQAGNHKIQLIAADAESVSYLILNLSISDTNRTPQINSPAMLTGKEGAPYEYEVLAIDADIIEDLSHEQVLRYSMIQGPEGLSFTHNRLSWIPGFDQAGQHPVIIEVSDGLSQVQQSFMIEVSNTNRAPIFDSHALSYILEDRLYEYEIEVVDHDGDSTELTLETAPEQLKLNGNTLSWKPSFQDAGEYLVVLKVTDGKLQSTQEFSLLVDNNNRLPTFKSTPATIAHESVKYKYQLKVEDADNEQLGLILLQGPKGMALGRDGSIHWTPGFQQHGKHTVKISASDGIDTQFQTFFVSVGDTNREPLLKRINDQHIVSGKKFRYQLQASDADGSKLSYRLVHAPPNMEINRKGKLYWKTRDTDIGKHTIIISVSDGELKMRRHFDIDVSKKL